MAGGLDPIVQDDFSAGAFPLFARDQIPRNGLEDAVNCLISSEGLPYRRGGSSYKGDAPAGDAAGGVGDWLWDGTLGAGERTLETVIAPSFLAKLRGLDPSDDHTPRDTGVTADTYVKERKVASLHGLLFFPPNWIYAGYLAGTGIPGSVPLNGTGTGALTFTNGSTTVVNSVGEFVAGAGAAGLIITPITAQGYAWVVVKSVTDATHLELTEPWPETNYTTPAGGAGWRAGAFTSADNPAFAAGFVSAAGFLIHAAVGGRLLVSGGAPSNRIYESLARTPRRIVQDDYWDLPEGAQVLGIEPYRDTAIVFSSRGVWAIYNVALDLTDLDGNLQQRLEEIERDTILWSAPGVAAARGQLIVPTLDGIVAFNPVSGAQRISNGIDALYRSYIDAGYHAGGAIVFRNHYFLPIRDAGGAVVDVLSCRLAPTRRGRGLATYPWTRHGGYGGQIASFAVRTRFGQQPSLIGLHQPSGRILNVPYLTPSVANAADADGSAHQAQIVTREPSAGNGVKNFWEKVRVTYELTDPAANDPTLAAEYAEDTAGFTALTGTAPEAILTSPKTWLLRKRGYGKRLRLTTSNPASKFILHAIEWFVRPSGRE